MTGPVLCISRTKKLSSKRTPFSKGPGESEYPCSLWAQEMMKPASHRLVYLRVLSQSIQMFGVQALSTYLPEISWVFQWVREPVTSASMPHLMDEKTCTRLDSKQSEGLCPGPPLSCFQVQTTSNTNWYPEREAEGHQQIY